MEPCPRGACWPAGEGIVPEGQSRFKAGLRALGEGISYSFAGEFQITGVRRMRLC